jgi:hypothetical protein
MAKKTENPNASGATPPATPASGQGKDETSATGQGATPSGEQGKDEASATVQGATPPATPASGQGKDETSTTVQGATPPVTPPVTPASRQAKDKTDTAPEAPKVSDAVVKVGKGLLASHPEMKVVYMTADGTGFYMESDAASHARTLNNKAVTPVKRD